MQQGDEQMFVSLSFALKGIFLRNYLLHWEKSATFASAFEERHVFLGLFSET